MPASCGLEVTEALTVPSGSSNRAPACRDRGSTSPQRSPSHVVNVTTSLLPSGTEKWLTEVFTEPWGHHPILARNCSERPFTYLGQAILSHHQAGRVVHDLTADSTTVIGSGSTPLPTEWVCGLI